MRIVLQKQPEKYLSSVSLSVRIKLYKVLDHISRLEGDIKRLAGYENLYRYKLTHYRILFSVNTEDAVITVSAINTRTNIKY